MSSVSNASRARSSPRSKRGSHLQAGLYVVLILGALTMLAPFLWMVSTSLKQPHEVFGTGGGIRWLPERFLWQDRYDLDDPSAFARRLSVGDDRYARSIRRRLSEQTQHLLRRYDPSRPVSQSLRQALLHDLNRLISGALIFDPKRQRNIEFTGELAQRIRGKPRGRDLANLNADLLRAVFARELAEMRLLPAFWRNYPDAWNEISILRLYLSSIFVAIVGTFGQVLTSSMAAYAFARLRFPGRDKLFFAYLATMMIPGSVTMIPVFVILKSFGWINTYQALIIPGLFSAYGTFMLRQFFMGLPSDLEDAAKIDGSGYIGIWTRVILPLSKPALATLTTFTFMGFWGSYMWPLVVTVTEPLRTLPIGLKYFVGLHATNYTQLMAGSVIALIPVLLLFIFNQRYFVEGIKLSGIKG